MLRRALNFGPVLLAMGAVGCSSASPPALLPSAQLETGSAGPTASALAQSETTVLAQGTATEVYALVARGALRCWFGADGPLKATHIFNADAASPAQGGAAEIVVHERDPTARDPRGNRALRVTFLGEVTGVRVGITPIKVPDALAQPMVRDVETWARGGEGCQARAASPPQAMVPAPPLQPPAKTKGARK